MIDNSIALLSILSQLLIELFTKNISRKKRNYEIDIVYKCFILCLDSLALKSKRKRQKPLPGYPRCAYMYMKCH